jgi:hypothetical protein
MARRKNETNSKRPIESYEHRDKKRINNPQVGLVTPESDPDAGGRKKRYAYDPHLDPQLVWAGKAEHTSFEVPTVSLHVHERIDPRTIIEAVRKKNGQERTLQLGLFEEERREPLRQAIEFYQHKHGWSNRLIAGDSLLVMNSLLGKEGMAGKVQMIYIDPPYGIKYGSNFQPFVNKRDVKDGKDEDLTAEPEQIRAFRDTWELGIHSYLTYLRDRLLLARELLHESGSIFVQISDENVHYVRELMDEVFGARNFVRLITFAASDDKTFTMPSGQVVKVNELVEWEVPFEFPPDWPAEAREPFKAFHSARRAMQKEIDAAIARHAPQETLYDQPFVDRKRVRVSGPFTVEAVPAPAVKSVDEILESKPEPADASIARSGETLRQAEWRDELLRAGIRAKNGQYIRFARLEPLPGCRWLHADGETRPSDEGADRVREEAPAYNPMRVVVSFGPEHAPLEQRQVAQAIEEAQTLVPKPKLIVFAAFQFDPEAAKDIDETNWPGVTLLKAQMNADLLTDDLKKKRASNESFWLIGQPDVVVERIAEGEDKGKYTVSVHGFDYYNTKTGGIESGGDDKIAVWLLDTDYDGRSLYPRQVFFPMAGENEGWARLARNLKAEIDEELIEAYRGTVSLPFEPGEHKRIAVKIVDDRGIESLKVIELE